MKIGPYEVLLELGRGGMGTVYLARLVGVGGFERLVAIKRAHAAALAQKGTSERFLREARLAASVHHANVVGIHQVGEDADGQYLACDYVEGEGLDRLIEGHGTPAPLPVAITLRIVLDALSGLHAAHETLDGEGKPLGILHRDVSIENLLVGRDGVTRLTDFGIAKSYGPGLTDAGTIHGKLMYLTPEYLQGAESQRYDDTYAMGVTLWIALSGAFPYRARDQAALTREVLSQPIPALSSVGISVGPLLDACLARALSRDPAARYQTARAMLDALEEVSTRETSALRHLDVADFVERVAGEKLAQRRSTIQASRVAHDAAIAPVSSVPNEAVVFDTLQNVTTVGGVRDKLRWPWFLALLVGGGLLAMWLLTRGPVIERAGPSAAAPGRAASAPASTTAPPPAASRVAEPAPVVEQGLTLPGSPDAGTSELSPPRVLATPKKARSAGGRRSTRSPGEDAQETPRAPTLDITTDNPYR